MLIYFIFLYSICNFYKQNLLILWKIYLFFKDGKKILDFFNQELNNA